MRDTDPFPRTLRIGILVFDGFEPIDVWGFVEAFSISRFIGTSYAGGPPYPFEIVLISNQCKPDGGGATPAPVKSMNGPRVAPDYFRDEALEQYRAVLKLDPKRATVHYYVGNILAQKQSYAEAVAAYQEALKQDPDLKVARQNLDRVIPAQASIASAIDFSHPARTQRREDLVGPDPCADG